MKLHLEKRTKIAKMDYYVKRTVKIFCVRHCCFKFSYFVIFEFFSHKLLAFKYVLC